MAITKNLVGNRFGPYSFTYNEDKVILYALSIGAGVEELDFVYEKGLKVFPTFAVIPSYQAIVAFGSAVDINLAKVLHGEHQTITHRLIPKSGKFSTVGVITSIYDKGESGAIFNLSFETRDEHGEMYFESKESIIDRSAGNFGGDRGPKAKRFDPPEGKAPDFHVEHHISPDQAALYRLLGDKNPIHIEPSFARRGGYDKPFLHGLCVYGFAGRAVLHSVCGSDPIRFRSFSARFMDVVYPGDTIITEGWRVGEGSYVVRTTNQEGKVVLGNAMVEVE